MFIRRCRPTFGTRRLLVGGLVAVSLLSAACSSSTKSNAGTPTTSGGSTETTTGSPSSGPNTPAPQPLPALTSVTLVQVSPAEYLAPYYLAQAFGEFKKENLNVTIAKLGFTDALALMEQGKVQMLSAGASAGMLNQIAANGAFAQVGHTFDLIPNTKTGLYVRKEFLNPDGTLNCADVPKMTFNFSTGGIAASIVYVIKPILDKCGYSLTKVKSASLGGTDSYPALENGAVSLSYLNTPQAQEAANANFAKLLPNTGYSLASYMMATSFIKSQPAVAAAILRAIMRTQRTYLQGDYHSNQQVVNVLSQNTGATAAQIAQDEPLLFTTDLQFSKSADDAVLGIQNIWIQYGIVAYKQPLTLSQINDMNLATQVANGCGGSAHPCTG